MTAPYLLSNINKTEFPSVELALREPDGLLAVGGDLSVERLKSAYQQGIFPWYSEGQPVLWWSPDPRMILAPDEIKISRSLAKKIRKQHFQITFDHDFNSVIKACSESRHDKSLQENKNEINESEISDTWILDEMIQAYIQLHQAGYAHSIECWQDDKLVGGLYGVAIGKVFFGESMFSRVSDASKIAFVYLCKQLQLWEFKLIDCQVYTSHLESLGAKMISRNQFITLLNQHCLDSNEHNIWHSDVELSNQVLRHNKKMNNP